MAKAAALDVTEQFTEQLSALRESLAARATDDGDNDSLEIVNEPVGRARSLIAEAR